MKKGVFISICLWGAYSFWSSNNPVIVDTDISAAFPISFLRGLSVTDEPFQKKINYKNSAYQYNDFMITPLAEFQVAARVLSSKRYNRGLEAKLSPVDLALGWGPMSDPDIIEQFSIRQSNRFFFLANG